MIVKCYLNKCGFCEGGWCTKPIVILDENGMCNHVWYHGHQLMDAFREVEHELPQIVEGDYEDVRTREDVNEECIECDGDFNDNNATDECNDSSNDGESGEVGTTDKETS